MAFPDGLTVATVDDAGTALALVRRSSQLLPGDGWWYASSWSDPSVARDSNTQVSDGVMIGHAVVGVDGLCYGICQ